jgi:hypothetical protein
MKRAIGVLVCGLIALLPMLPATASAADSGTATITHIAVPTDIIPNDDTSILQRITIRKKESGLQLTDAIKTHLAQTCQAAQTKLKAFNTANEKSVGDRMKAYNAWLEQLQNLVDRGTMQKLDVAALKNDEAQLKAKIVTFQQELTPYREALTDLSSMDCKSDPTGFKVSLDSARQLVSNAANAASDIRNFVNSTVKPDINKLKTAIDNAGGTTNG